SVVDLCKTIDGEKVLDKVSFTVTKGDKIAFVGSNEVAYTTLFKILSGEMEPDSGQVKWGVTITKAYFPKDTSPYFQDQELNLVDWLRQYSSDKADSYVRGFLGKMLFSGEEALKPLKVLSGGERVRCMLAKIMLCNANVLLLDQPTNHLDLESITALNNGLRDYSSNVLFTSHDRQLVQTIANRVIELTPTKMVDVRLTYHEYLESIAI
ncbi:MAG: ATP-binding cassette domain-containing protein, partial [Dethiobacteraceae bacterium]